MTERHPAPETAAAVLAAARSSRANADAEEARLLTLAVDWAAMHSVDSITHAAVFADTAMTVAGPGAPLVSEFCVAEFAAAIGLPTEAGKAYLGEGVELRYRLPRTWTRVLGGDLPAWRARRVAAATLLLTAEAAAYVDTHIAHVAHKIRTTQLDKLIDEAIARYMPDEATRRRNQAADGRHFSTNTRQPSLQGTSDVWGSLDTADALDLDAAVTAGAETLKTLGSTDTLDVRRAIALGQLARHEQTLDLPPGPAPGPGPGPGPVVEEVAQQPSRNPQPTHPQPTRPARQVVLYVHLSEAAIRHNGVGGTGGVGRFENTRSPITAAQIRDWCGTPGAQVIVKPVIDLNDHIHVDAYEIPDRLTEAATLADHTCVFPWCTRPARAVMPGEHAADCDHIHPHHRHATGNGTTSSCNLAPLCRRHHRLKTHGGWSYTQVERGSYLWASPHGYHYLRNHHGTLDLGADLWTHHHHTPAEHARRA